MSRLIGKLSRLLKILARLIGILSRLLGFLSRLFEVLTRFIKSPGRTSKVRMRFYYKNQIINILRVAGEIEKSGYPKFRWD